MSEITLANLGGGAAIEKVQEELERVIENILDPNTEALAKRQIVLTISIRPGKDRSFGEVEVSTMAKLAPSVAFATRAFFGVSDDKKPVAYEDNPRQVTIADFVASKSNVAELNPQKEKAAT